MELQQPFYERMVRPMIQRLARAGRRQEGGLIQRIDAKLERAGYPGGLRGADWIGVKLMSAIGVAVSSSSSWARSSSDRRCSAC